MDFLEQDKLALEAAFSLHEELLNTESPVIYEGSLEDFWNLANELLRIITEEFEEDPDKDDVVTRYWEINLGDPADDFA